MNAYINEKHNIFSTNKTFQHNKHRKQRYKTDNNFLNKINAANKIDNT